MDAHGRTAAILHVTTCLTSLAAAVAFVAAMSSCAGVGPTPANPGATSPVPQASALSTPTDTRLIATQVITSSDPPRGAAVIGGAVAEWREVVTMSTVLPHMDYAVEAVVAEVGALRYNTPSGEAPLGQPMTITHGSPWESCWPLRLVVTNVLRSRYEPVPDGFTTYMGHEHFPADVTREGWPAPEQRDFSEEFRVYKPMIRLEVLHHQPVGILLAIRSSGIQDDWCLDYAEEWAEALSTSSARYEAVVLPQFYEYLGDDVYKASVQERLPRARFLSQIEQYW
jgi:hypothetical protein